MPVNRTMLAAQIAGMFVVFTLALFVAAGTINWPAGWAFLVLFFGFTIAISIWLLRHNPGLLTERMTGIGKADQKVWDKVFTLLAQIVFLGWLVLAPLDAVRFRWSHMPASLQLVGAILLVISFYLFFLTFRENAYLSPAVRIQRERGQAVVSTGPYRYVRHPMYATAIIFLVGATLLLGSWLGLLVQLILVLGLAFRAVAEERVLREELPGYSEYMASVRWRFIPHVF